MEQPEAIIFDFDGTLVDLDGFIEKYTSDFISENKLDYIIEGFESLGQKMAILP